MSARRRVDLKSQRQGRITSMPRLGRPRSLQCRVVGTRRWEVSPSKLRSQAFVLQVLQLRFCLNLIAFQMQTRVQGLVSLAVN